MTLDLTDSVLAALAGALVLAGGESDKAMYAFWLCGSSPQPRNPTAFRPLNLKPCRFRAKREHPAGLKDFQLDLALTDLHVSC